MKSRTWTAIIATISLAAFTPASPTTAQDGQANQPKHHHYKLIDMGTFGGPASSINFPFSQGTVNNNGMAVGWSATGLPALPTSSFLICGGLDAVVPFITHTFEWDGAVRDLSALPPSGTNCSEPFYMNSKGEVVGASETAEIDPQFFGLQQIHAVLWKGGQIIDLGTLGGNQAAAFGINNRGQIVGSSTNIIPDPYCFFATVQQRAFIWENGNIRDIGTLGGNCAGIGIVDANIHAINEAGQIVGGSTTNPAPNPLTGSPTWEPSLWDEGTGMTDLGTLGGAYGGAQAINNNGQIIGQSSISADPGACNGFPDNNDLNCHGFLWNQGKLIDLTTSSIGGSPEFLAAINDEGEIIGWGVFPSSPLEAFVWRKGVATDLGHLDGCFSFTHSINSLGQIVGAAISCDGNSLRAFLWEQGSMVDLNTLVPPESDLQLIDATGINDRGEIVGDGVPSGTSTNRFVDRGFLLIPCDENHPDIDGCDYDPVQGSTNVTSHSAQKTTLSPETVKRLMRSAGFSSSPWSHVTGSRSSN